MNYLLRDKDNCSIDGGRLLVMDEEKRKIKKQVDACGSTMRGSTGKEEKGQIEEEFATHPILECKGK